ncbi:hypothetical protein N8524_11165, partial [Candidatus Puniceispirillum sp.]|nr:hypothetical protein [Candidatus Puniceispirillum sp.]
MGQQVSVTKLKEQIEAAKRGLAEMSPVITAADPLFRPAAMQAANFVTLAGGHEDGVPDALNQNMAANDEMATGEMATGEMATGEDFQFFHRPKRSDRPLVPSPPISMANVDISAAGADQPLFQAFDQRLD